MIVYDHVTVCMTLTMSVCASVYDSVSVLLAGPQLKAISTLSVGTANIDISECKKRNIEVACVADVASDSAAEFTVALVLVVARRLLEGQRLHQT